NATYNYWGSCDGPSGAGPGTGDAVSTNVDYTPWLGICIQNKTHYPLCVIESDNVILQADLSGILIKDVEFSYTINETNYNQTATLVDDKYQITIPSTELVRGNINWNVYVDDYFNIYNNSWQTFYVNSITKLTVAPELPDGNNEWYITEPLFTLTNQDSSTIYYQWNSAGIEVISPPHFLFGLENVPNQASDKGIKLFLKYWSDVCSGEEHQQQEISVDLLDPVMKNFFPANNSKINSVSEISVLIDNVIGEQSSGLDESSIVMKLNNIPIPFTTTAQPGLNLLVTHYPENLSDGIYEVYIEATDNAGRTAQAIWNFEISQQTFDMQIYSPDKSIYDIRRLEMNISLDREVEKLEYLDSESSSNRYRTLCRNCNEYGFLREKTKSFSEGEHNLSIRATDEFGNSVEKNISFLIDSKNPRISRTEPRIRSITNGNDFYVKFKEDNVKELILNINGTIYPIDKNECLPDRNYLECYLEIDVDQFDGEEVEYFFKITDIAGNIDESRLTKIKIDTNPPKINNPTTFYTNDSRYIHFNVNITEENLDEVYLTYDYHNRSRESRLCSRLEDGICEKKFRYRDYYANYQLNVIDEAGNSIAVPVVLI
ncbi:MAG: hypothetical protein ABIA78_01420, partial [archaeon]